MKKIITANTVNKRGVSKKQSGFTMVELIIVVFIITALSSIIVLAYPGIVEKAKMKSDIYSAKTIASAIKIYELDKGEKFSLGAAENLVSKLTDSGYLEPDSPKTPVCGGSWKYDATSRKVSIEGAQLNEDVYDSLGEQEKGYFTNPLFSGA
jgi:prepilin-type N-terminal cleavage/methylation domain-containing protein